MPSGLQGRDLMVISNDYESGGESFWEGLPRSFLLSICSSVIPVGYTNDRQSHHPLRLKGGMFVLLNFFFNTVWIGLALGFTIVHYVPNNVQGISIPQPSVKVEVSCTSVESTVSLEDISRRRAAMQALASVQEYNSKHFQMIFRFPEAKYSCKPLASTYR